MENTVTPSADAARENVKACIRLAMDAHKRGDEKMAADFMARAIALAKEYDLI